MNLVLLRYLSRFAYFRLAASFRKFAPRACIFSHTLLSPYGSQPHSLQRAHFRLAFLIL